ncbi:uncharacterized protein RAG0_04168 [Rhynchosporium agropyri]|uniref:Uncharacterized protein n=1 Tax=Rhynchosporium agropyri TaxID=914238 RepID=A0A1E1K7R9_9HELO|nr:uncharacterized protein RAG0_04168 [Rhynchosporium agropyri]
MSTATISALILAIIFGAKQVESWAQSRFKTIHICSDTRREDPLVKLGDFLLNQLNLYMGDYKMPDIVSRGINWMTAITALCALPPYLVARMYIVVESFMSLRHVPIGVYQSPSVNFFGNIPHIQREYSTKPAF